MYLQGFARLLHSMASACSRLLTWLVWCWGHHFCIPSQKADEHWDWTIQCKTVQLSRILILHGWLAIVLCRLLAVADSFGVSNGAIGVQLSVHSS